MTEKSKEHLETEARMHELMKPIDEHIMAMKDQHDQMMLACAMLQRSKEILDFTIGVEGRKNILEAFSNDEYAEEYTGH